MQEGSGILRSVKKLMLYSVNTRMCFSDSHVWCVKVLFCL